MSSDEERRTRATIQALEDEIRDLEELLDDPGPEAIKVLFDWRGAVSIEDLIAEKRADLAVEVRRLEDAENVGMKEYPYDELEYIQEEIAAMEADLEELEREREELSRHIGGSSPTAEQTIADAIVDIVEKIEEYEAQAADLRRKLRKETKSPDELEQALEVLQDDLLRAVNAEDDAAYKTIQRKIDAIKNMLWDIKYAKGEVGGLKEGQPLRRALIVTGNAYVDRDDEIIRQVAFEAMVDSCWKEGQFAAEHPLLFWHRGDPIGRVVWADTFGPFLVEVAEELPDHQINVADKSDPAKFTTVKEIWDIIEASPIDWGASYEFFFADGDADDGVFDEIIKTETSVLPRGQAANGFTLCQVL